MALTRLRHGMAKRIGTRQLQPEDGTLLIAQRRAAIEQQCRSHVAYARNQVAKHARLGAYARTRIDVMLDKTVDIQLGAVFQAIFQLAMRARFEPAPQV